MNGQVGDTGAVGWEEDTGGRGEGREAGQLGERGLAEVKNSWTLWCWRTRRGSAVGLLGGQTGQQGDGQAVRTRDAASRRRTEEPAPRVNNESTTCPNHDVVCSGCRWTESF